MPELVSTKGASAFWARPSVTPSAVVRATPLKKDLLRSMVGEGGLFMVVLL